jgi:hypothetical protein
LQAILQITPHNPYKPIPYFVAGLEGRDFRIRPGQFRPGGFAEQMHVGAIATHDGIEVRHFCKTNPILCKPSEIQLSSYAQAKTLGFSARLINPTAIHARAIQASRNRRW